MNPSHPKSRMNGRTCSLLMVCCLFGSPPTRAQQSLSVDSSRTETSKTEHLVIPPGTILPVALQTTISASKGKAGQPVRGEIAQDVPLPGNSKIPKGSRMEGHIVEVTPAAGRNVQNISIRFDKLYSAGKAIPVTTSLRAMAGFMEVLAAGTPQQGVGESDVFNWMTTTQIGGDSVYGRGGTVTSTHNGGQVVGTAPISGGVLVLVSANASGHCRGAIDDNENPQALWVFSSDACGTYGLSKIHLVHAGRTEPVGTFTLQLEGQKTKIHSGDGMLLRVIG